MFSFFKSNEVIKRKRQQELANHFALTDAHEEQGSIALAQAGVGLLKVVMYAAFVSLGFFLPFEGARQIMTIVTLGVLGFFVIRFKTIFTEKLFIAQLNLSDETLPEKVHIGAEKQYSENITKVVALWVFSLAVVTGGGYFAAKKFVGQNIEKVSVSKELQQNYDAASLTYSTAVQEGKSSAYLKPLLKGMQKAEKDLTANRNAVKAQNEFNAEDSKMELYGYAGLAAGIEFLVGLFLFQLMYYIENKQFEEHKADKEKNPNLGAFNGDVQPKKPKASDVDTAIQAKIDAALAEAEKNEAKRKAELEAKVEAQIKQAKIDAALAEKRQKEIIAEQESKKELSNEELEIIWAKKRKDAKLKKDLDRELLEINTQLELERLQQELEEKKKKLALQQRITQEVKPSVNGYGGKS